MDRTREFVLNRPRMFLGHDQWDADGLYILIFEIIRLAIRPELANLCSNLRVIIDSEKTLSIVDDGRGLPVEVIRIGESEELPKIEHVFSFMLTTNPPLDYYKKFGFLNHLGYILNAVSERLQIETNFEGSSYELSCARGKIVEHLQKVSNPIVLMGTRLTFTPDSELFPHFKVDFEKLLTGLRDLKQEYPTVYLTLEDEKSG